MNNLLMFVHTYKQEPQSLTKSTQFNITIETNYTTLYSHLKSSFNKSSTDQGRIAAVLP